MPGTKLRAGPRVLIAAAALIGALLVAPAAIAKLPDPVPCTAGPCFAPSQGARWQWQICCSRKGAQRDYVKLNHDVEFFDIDLFENRRRTVRRIHGRGDAAICYVDAGTLERWRPDAEKFRGHHGFIGKPLDDWPGQRWVDVRRSRIIRPIMRARLDKCARRGYDGAQFDDLDGWQLPKRKQGFPTKLRGRHVLRYAAWLANAAHRRGLSAAFENDLEQAKRLEPRFEWLIVEDCARYRECKHDGIRAFLDAGKFAGPVEYTDWKRLPELSVWCGRLLPGSSGMIKRRNLRSWRRPCP